MLQVLLVLLMPPAVINVTTVTNDATVNLAIWPLLLMLQILLRTLLIIMSLMMLLLLSLLMLMALMILLEFLAF